MPRTGRGTGDRWPRPRKRLGQHFLSDPRILSRIIDALDPGPDDTVVEVGAGRGALTTQLLARAARVVAIELDDALAARLRDDHAGDPRLAVIARDVLDISLAEVAGTDHYLVVGNVPYYVTTPILFHALAHPRPARAVFLVQREVADRVVAAPGTDAYGALSVNVQALATATSVFSVPPGAFTPPPSVDSTVLRIVPRSDPIVPPDEQAVYSAFVIAAFGLRRKQMRRVVRTVWGLSATEAVGLLAAADIAADARPEVLTPRAFGRLLRAWSARHA